MEVKTDEVDLSKLTLQELLDHKSWKARQKGYEDVNNLMLQSTGPKDAVFTKYCNGVKGWTSESNVNALEKGLDAVLTFVENAGNAQRSASDVCPVLVQKCVAHTKQKIKEKSLEILLMYIEIEKPDVVTEALIEGFANKNPKVIAQSVSAFATAISLFGVQSVNVKSVMKQIAPLLENRDKDVRQHAKLLAVELFRWIGGIALKPQLQNIKPLQLAELEEEFSKEKEAKVTPVPSRYLRSQKPTQNNQMNSAENDENLDSSGAQSDTGVAAQQALDPWDLLTPTDVIAKLPKNFFEQVESSKWAERKECLEVLLKLCTDNPRLDTSVNYGELVSVLKKVIGKDSNINVVSFAAKCVAALAEGLRKKFSPFTSMLFPIILEKFKDKKPLVTNACIEAVDAIFKTTNLEAISEDLVAALDNKTPSVKTQTTLFMSRAFAATHSSILTKKLLKTFCAALVKNIESSDLDVRNASASAIGAALKVAGEKNVMPFLAEIKDDHLKMDKIKECCEKTILDPSIAAASAPAEAAPAKNVKTAAAPKAAAPKQPSTTQNIKPSSTKDNTETNAATESKAVKADAEEQKPVVNNRSQSAARKPGETAKSKKEPEAAADGAALLDTNQKGQRLQEERSLKILKWNFTAPTDEHVEQLQSQLSTICKPALYTNLFNANFKLQLKALETLNQCLETAPDASINGSDLLQKWCTLRFFETNPSVLIKSLEYLQLLLQLMLDRQIELHDFEVTSFVPYLLIKAGDQKDAVRNEVRRLIEKLSRLYPATKLFQLLLESCKSTKNSRQKAECLDQLGSFIDLLGVQVCGTPPTQCLRAISQMIGEKDTSVRNAALNAVVSAYNHMGDKVHKAIGPMNEKDFAMLQERIKRSTKGKPNSAATAGPLAMPSAINARPQTAQASVGRQSSSTAAAVAASSSHQPMTARDVSRSPPRNNLLMENDRLNDYDDAENDYKPYRLEISKIFDKQQMSRYGQRKPMPSSSIRPEVERDLAVPFQRPRIERRAATAAAGARGRSPAVGDQRGIAGERTAADDEALGALDVTISQVAVTSITTAVQSLVQLDEILKDPVKSNFLVGKVDTLLLSIFFQLKLACNSRMKDASCDQNEVLRLFRHLCVVLLSLCSSGVLIQEASDGALKDLICQLLTVLVDDRLSKTNEGSELIRSINMLVVNLVTKSDHTVCLVALLRLLRDSLHSQTSSMKFQELVMRCIWKLSRQLPTFAEELQLDRILAECHNFFADFPSESWQNRPSNTPLRTVKTILNSLCNIVGHKILNHVSMIDREESSEAVQYLKKCLSENYARGGKSSSEALKNDDAQKVDSNGALAEKMANAAQLKEKIMGILRKVGDKDHSKQGLVELYEFLHTHQDFEMEPYYKKCSAEFRAYIEKNLNKLSIEKVSSYTNGSMDLNKSNENYSVTSEAGIDAIQKLQKLREKCGLQPLKVLTPVKQSSSKVNLILPEVSTDYDGENKVENVGHEKKEQESAQAVSMEDISDLRLRLERVKRDAF